MSALMSEIREAHVEKGTLGLWFLGQNGWIVKSPGGTVVAIDPYLSNGCHPSRRGLNLDRLIPVPIDPAALAVDLVACTHSHPDHADPLTLAACARSGRVGGFLGPGDTQTVFAQAGIAENRCTVTWPNAVTELGDLRLTGTFALPTDGGDLTHMGFVIQAGRGPKIWVVGDSAWCDLLAEAGLKHLPDVICVPINGGYANLSHWEAAELVRRLAPAQAIPCHWDMFHDNSCPPHLFEASLTVKGVARAFRLPRYAEMMVIDGN